MKTIILGLLMCFVVIPQLATAAEVKNLNVTLEGDKAVASYDLVAKSDEKTAEVTVSINVNGDKKTSDQLHLTGDFGKKVKVGKGKRIVWNATADLPANFDGNINWDVQAMRVAIKAPVRAAIKASGSYTDPATRMEFVGVPGGCFQMGDTFGDGGASEKPGNQVCVSNFFIGKYLVTQSQWQAVMGNNPSLFSECGGNCPVETVSWKNVQEFIRQLNASTGRNYRLPYESEWEYAARSGGQQEQWAGTSDLDELGAYAWFDENSGKMTHPVGTRKPNGLGLYDMTGNVWEWCKEWYEKDYYQNSPEKNPRGPLSGSFRILRGGSWNGSASLVRASRRFSVEHSDWGSAVGLRLVLPADQ